MLDDRLTDVINRKNSDFLVIGPPGSGKTHTLLELAGYLVNTKKIDPEKILIFCFNRRWSKLIREETTSIINKSILEIPIETFHSFCTSFISRSRVLLHLDRLQNDCHNGRKNRREDTGKCESFGDLNVLNSVQQWELLKSVIKALDEKKYPYTFKYINHSKFIENSYIQEIFDFILRAQENLFTPGELLDKFTPFFNPLLSEMAGIYSRYIDELRRTCSYNYGMLLEETAGILKKQKGIRDYYRERYDYILVDELQEINRAQFLIIKYISNSNCIYFGNDDQSIYGFRGSAQNIFKMVYNDLKPENVFFLKKNHRSTPAISEACNKFIGLVKDRIPKETTSYGNKPSGEIHLKEFSTLLDEASFICREIKSLYLKKGIKPEEIAIIIKGLGYETHIIENALLLGGVPFVRRGTRNLLDNKLIKYLLNFMRLMIAVKDIEYEGKSESSGSGSDSDNSVSDLDALIENLVLSDIIGLEPLYFRKLKKLFADDGGHATGGIWGHFRSQYIKAGNTKKSSTGTGRELLKIINFVSAVYRLMEIMGSKNVFEISLELIEDRGTGIMDYLKLTENNSIAGSNRWVNLGDFLGNVKDFSEKNTPGDIREYINFVDNIIESKFTEEIEESTRDMIHAGSVNIFSFHQCKGLEFKAVFIPFINKNYLPAKFTLTQGYDTRIFSYPDRIKNPDIEELKKDHMRGEIKLFYNGITRAEEFLYITSSSRRKSIFFEEMEKIARNLKCGTGSDKETGEGEVPKIPENTLIGKSGFTGIESFEDIDLNNIWLTRKKALVAVSRLENNLKVEHKCYRNKIIFLKHFYNPAMWWDFIKPTRNMKNPLNIFSQSFSFSSIDILRDCPLKYKFKYYFSLREKEGISLIVGKIYHEVLKIFFSSKDDYSWEKLEKIINEVFEKANFDFKFLKEDFREKALVEFKNFFDNMMPSKPQKSIVEKEFSFNTEKGEIKGRIDQINVTGEKDIEIIDYKSGSSSYSDRDLKEELQLKVYRMALEMSKDLKDFRSMNSVMKYICLGNLKKPLYIVPGDYYDRNKIRWILNKSISRIKKEKFDPEPKNYSSCLNCGFKILCPKYYG
jgi:DNA helicase II / ATP-dependent DNA helicase PcrA